MDQDVTLAYELGSNCYMVKPQQLNDLVQMVDLAFRFWTMCAMPPLPDKC
ncbi:MAG TPA: hypothetical protein VK633_00190 [Verrucomicrobiae bacterium]|nr:hypothetical protein [Verrucomicrobiae bacterium]